MKKLKTLYKADRLGNIRIWYVEHDDEKYRSISGLKDGKHVIAGWIYPTPKNIGKSNETSTKEQVDFEVAALYEYQLNQGKYHEELGKNIWDGAKYIECMLAVTYDKKKHKQFPYMKQPKLNGARCIGVDGKTQTRQGKFFVSVPHIENIIQQFNNDYPGFYLDGELYNHELNRDFEKIMSLIRKAKPSSQDLIDSEKYIKYYVYDVITPYPMSSEDRVKFLEENVYGKYDYIVEVETTIVYNEKQLNEEFAKDLEQGYEGTMLRKHEDYYEKGRNKALIKCKVFKDIECEVLDIEEGTGVWSGHAKSIVIKLPSGKTQSSNIKGNFEYLKNIYDNKQEYIGGPATVKFQDYTADEKLIFPYITYMWGKERDV